MIITVFPKIFTDAVLDILTLPIWWYTKGAQYFFLRCWDFFLVSNDMLYPGVWLKNLFVPMYGQYDFAGRLISFFMRLVQLIVRSLMMLIWLVVCLAIFIVWLVLPLVIIFLFMPGFAR